MGRNPSDQTNDPSCTSDKIFPFLLGYNTADVNITAMQIDGNGNILFAGWGKRQPFGYTPEPPATDARSAAYLDV